VSDNDIYLVISDAPSRLSYGGPGFVRISGDGQASVVPDSAIAAAIGSSSYIVGCYVPGAMTADQTLLYHRVAKAVTLPANLGIAFNAHLDYSAVAVGDEVYIMASDLVEATAQKCGFQPGATLAQFKGSRLERLEAKHPFLDRPSLFVLGDHVTLEQGTGCVHTAPGHGHEDYAVGKAYGLDIYCPVNGRGQFEEGTEFFAGMN